MRRTVLIYNPASGQYSAKREALVQEALALLRQAGVEAEALETSTPESARTYVEDAVRRGCDSILACGGDGTVHAILQCVVGTSVALGVVPLGTANALAQDLGLGAAPLKAVRTLLTATPVEVPIGRIFYHDDAGKEVSRYFTVAAGVGADALMMSRLDARLKRRFGYLLYVVEGTRVWLSHSFPLFEAAFKSNGSYKPRIEAVSQLLAVRVRSFGGVLGKLAPGATVRKSSLSVVAFKTRSRMHYLRFLLAVAAGRHTFSNAIELLEVASVDCRMQDSSMSPIYVEADGEPLGMLPARIEVAAETLRLLIPPGARP